MKKEVENKWVIILGCLLLFCVQFIANMVTVALPTIALDLDLNVEMLNAINLVFFDNVCIVNVTIRKICFKIWDWKIPQMQYCIDDCWTIDFCLFNRY